MFDSIIDVTYNTGRTWRVVYPHPIGAIVRVKVLATVLVETSAAHCDDETNCMLGERKGKKEEVKTCGQGKQSAKIAERCARQKTRSFDCFIYQHDGRLYSETSTPDTVSRYAHATVRHCEKILTLAYPLPPYLEKHLSPCTLGGVWPTLYCISYPDKVILHTTWEKGGARGSSQLSRGVWLDGPQLPSRLDAKKVH